ncbi:MAG: hypothetical protein M8353_06485 [ANME-2 cluster archaeon]|nr:hypothetical protein [ANME-2 cluster archaeon]
MLKKVIILLILFALVTAGCTEKDPTTTTTVSTSDGDVDIEYNIPEGTKDEWCPVGTTWQATNPQTGEMASMKVTGTETVDGVILCRAVMDSNTADEIAKMDYLWSEDGETFKWTYYDAAGKVVSIINMKDGKMVMTDEEGNVMEFDWTK